MTHPPRRTTTEQGLGWDHQKQRRKLIARHVDGTACPCLTDNKCGPACPCRRAGHGLPMYRNAARNADGAPLEADHTLARAEGGRRADRLLLRVCNRSRGSGTRRSPGEPEQWWSRQWLLGA